MSEQDSGSGRKRFMGDIMRRISPSGTHLEDEPSETGEQGVGGHRPKMRPVKHHAHGAVIELGKEDGFVSAVVAVGVVQCADVAAARDDDLALGVERHRVNVVGQVRPGVERRLKAILEFDG